MSFPAELRTLLLDARIALRGLPDFDEDPLRARMEQAILNLTDYVLPPRSVSTKSTAQQVALAWQTVCRGLKHSHPELYDELAAKVMILLDEKELVEPVTELLQLEAQVKQLESKQQPLQARLNEASKKASDALARIEQLYLALAGAAPQVLEAPDAQLLALKRIETLATQPSPARGGKKGAARVEAPAEDPIPNRAVLEAVAAEQRKFTKEQREWSVAECLALTGWQFTPVELIEKGDPWMAQRLLEGQTKTG